MRNKKYTSSLSCPLFLQVWHMFKATIYKACVPLMITVWNESGNVQCITRKAGTLGTAGHSHLHTS